jgi:hypothetical protein
MKRLDGGISVDQFMPALGLQLRIHEAGFMTTRRLAVGRHSRMIEMAAGASGVGMPTQQTAARLRQQAA